MALKKCSNCKVEKPFNEFNNYSKTKDKMGSYFRRCNNLKNSQ